jgi:D-threo-aldose 1-dehydrogenase
MTILRGQHRLLGKTGLAVPPVVCGTASLANVRRVVTDQAKLAICGEWCKGIEPPVLIEVAYDDGKGLALQVLSRMLRKLEVADDEVVILLTFGGDAMAVAAQSASSERLADCWEKSCQFLGSEYRPKLIAVTDGDDSSWQAAKQLKAAGQVRGVGLVVGGQHAAQSRAALVGPHWITLAGSCTVMRHSPETLAFVAEMTERQIPIVVSGVFDGGFLVGGNRLDGRALRPDDSADRSILAWRKSFVALCDGYGISPSHACIQFALSLPGVMAVRIDSSYPDRVAANIAAAGQTVPENFWASLREEGLSAGVPV